MSHSTDDHDCNCGTTDTPELSEAVEQEINDIGKALTTAIRTDDGYGDAWRKIRDVARLAAAEARREERERCARVAEYEVKVRAKAARMGALLHDPDGSLLGLRIAEAIRALDTEREEKPDA